MNSVFDSQQFNQNLFFPRSDNSATPDNTDDIFIKVENNCKLHVRVYRNLTKKFSILFFHGNGEIISDYNEIANLFLELGCEFIVSDFRGYGRSEGSPTLRSCLADASVIYSYLKNNKILNTKTCVMGRSLGSAPTIELCSKFSDIAACVIESGYADPIPLVQRRGLNITKISLEENSLFNNSTKIRLITCPILLMHGELDSLISADEAKLNYENVASNDKKLAILKGVGHNNMMMAKNNEYFASLSSFFNRSLT
jgi:alpha-beta hydrolase superfamily lysophospholipase